MISCFSEGVAPREKLSYSFLFLTASFPSSPPSPPRPVFELKITSVRIGMLVHWPENQPVRFEVFHEALSSPGDLEFC